MKIYEIENKLGLTDKINASAKASTEACVIDTEHQSIADNLYKEEDIKYLQNVTCKDLMIVNGILVSTNWNKNDDVFTPEEVWKARYTPEYKPVDMNHNSKETDDVNEIIGVITRATAVDDKYKPVYSSMDNTSNKKMPDLYHLLVSMYLWEQYHPTTVAEIKAAIDKKEQYISMECFFGNFGYALKSKDDTECMLMPRTDITAWLSGSLRIFGGTGQISINGKDYKVGRWLNDIIFSGAGFVKVPANTKSIVFSDYISFANANLNYKTVDEKWLENKNFDELSNNCVLSIVKGTLSLWPN